MHNISQTIISLNFTKICPPQKLVYSCIYMYAEYRHIDSTCIQREAMHIEKYVHTLLACMNNHICSTLFKTQERESDRRSKEIEQRKESQKNKTQTKQQEHVTLSTELQSTALTLNFQAASTAYTTLCYYLWLHWTGINHKHMHIILFNTYI